MRLAPVFALTLVGLRIAPRSWQEGRRKQPWAGMAGGTPHNKMER